MIVSQGRWQKYISDLRAVNDKATDSMLYYLQEMGIPETVEAMDDLVWTAYNISGKYGEAAATLAADFYDMSAEAAGKILPPAEPAATASYGEVAKAVKGTAKSGNAEMIASSVGRLVKMAGVDTTMQNALRDGAEWAWIPSGDTCAFCVMLASRGWQRASKKAIKGGHAEHIHANCDCTYAIRFDSTTDVAGYNNGNEYRKMYYSEDGTPEEKLNAMRREFYAENKEAINAQKRSAYAKRVELNSSAAEEVDV